MKSVLSMKYYRIGKNICLQIYNIVEKRNRKKKIIEQKLLVQSFNIFGKGLIW
jgi:hypothetical protein